MEISTNTQEVWLVQGSKEVFMDRVNLDSMLRGDLRKSYAHWSVQHPFLDIACVFPVTCSVRSGGCKPELLLLLDDGQQLTDLPKKLVWSENTKCQQEVYKYSNAGASEASNVTPCLPDRKLKQFSFVLHRMSVQVSYSSGSLAVTEFQVDVLNVSRVSEQAVCNTSVRPLTYCSNQVMAISASLCALRRCFLSPSVANSRAGAFHSASLCCFE